MVFCTVKILYTLRTLYICIFMTYSTFCCHVDYESMVYMYVCIYVSKGRKYVRIVTKGLLLTLIHVYINTLYLLHCN